MGSKFDIVVRIARRQHGRVAWRQLVAEGVDRHAIQRWLADRRLHPVHRGVYAVGHVAASLRGDYIAAVLACGEGAVLSHRAAAYLLGVLRGVAPSPEVTVPTTAGRRRRGIVIHRVKALDVLDASALDHIPVTPVPRVLLDLAPTSTPMELTRLCHEAWVRHDVTPRQVEACIARNPGKPGAAKLREALGADVTLSALEDAFIELLRAHGLALPRTNVDRYGDRVDCHWPEHGLTVELLSYRYHATRRAFEQDVARRRRSGHLAYTYGDVFERATETAAELSARLR